MKADLLLTLLEGSDYAAAVMPWDKPGPIRLPDDLDARRELVDAHLDGAAGTVSYAKIGEQETTVEVEAVKLSGLCPASDGLARWIAFDLDAADGHGQGGLEDPAAALRCVAERADTLGLLPGLVACRSAGGRGFHVWMILPEPVALDDAVIGAATLAACARRIADGDATDGGPHAFACADGSIASVGKPGAFELIPKDTRRPDRGWPLTLPAAGVAREHGGGIIIDAFTGEPVELRAIPRCPAPAWEHLLRDARGELDRRKRPMVTPTRITRRPCREHRDTDPMARIHPRTREFIDGQTPEGNRNMSAFAAACNLLAVGIGENEVERLILEGGRRCGLSEREGKAAFKSAARGTNRR